MSCDLQHLDFAASKASATSPGLSRYRIVHFATHRSLDSEHRETLRGGAIPGRRERITGWRILEGSWHLRLEPGGGYCGAECLQTGLGKEVEERG